MRAIAYHITWGTYGTRLHGDPRKTVDRKHNQIGMPFLNFDEHRWERSKEKLKYAPVPLTVEQMCFIESQIPSICERGYWKLHTCAAGPDHVHVVLSSEHHPDTIRRLTKRWLGQSLNEKWPLDDNRTYWAECGSIRWIDNERYFENATNYVTFQRATREPACPKTGTTKEDKCLAKL